MQRTSGMAEVLVGLIDGPIVTSHPDLEGDRIRQVSGLISGVCARASSIACMHGTFVAGILSAKRNSPSPGICPGCSLLVRPIFPETAAGDPMPGATPQELAAAIATCVDEGARVINISAAIVQSNPRNERELGLSLDHAASRGVIIVAASGNQGEVGSSVITRHPGVIPVAACDTQGRPINGSNLGISISRRGLSAPGLGVSGLGIHGKSLTLGGTSVAAPFVTGALALLFSEYPMATAVEVRLAATRANPTRRPSIVPPILNAWGAYQFLAKARAGRG